MQYDYSISNLHNKLVANHAHRLVFCKLDDGIQYDTWECFYYPKVNMKVKDVHALYLRSDRQVQGYP